VISAQQQITVTFPVMVSPSSYGAHVLNTAWAESPELSRPARADVVFTVEWLKVYLPEVLKFLLP
jgi:hypothetical protein